MVEASLHGLDALVREVARARERYLTTLGTPTFERATHKPGPDSWCLVEITEHITIAEQVGINGMWKALDAFQRGAPLQSGPLIHAGKPISQVIQETWKEREQVPPVAAPRWGGPIEFWIAALHSNQALLEALATDLRAVDLTDIVYPHPISGALDARQRLEFLAFHLDRHRAQVERAVAHAGVA